MIKKTIFMSAAVLAFAQSASAACTDLSSNLGYGSQGSDVLSFQLFLQSQGLLSATPNGNFGPATLAATKLFQARSGIEATGYVGPLTRIALRAQSCAANAGIPATPETPAPAQSASSRFASPQAGESVTIGESFEIRWNEAPNSIYSIILEDDKGVAKGYITANRYGGTSYEWRAGRVSSASNESSVVEPGTYRIRLRGAFQTSTDSDPVSATFSLKGPAISVSRIMPNSAPADGETAVVLYGSGFTSSTQVYLDGVRNISTSRLFVSSDGKVIVFSVPPGVAPGNHVVSLRNSYSWVDNAGTLRIE